jgi:predicted dehydrogenase
MAFPHDAHLGMLADFLDAIERDRPPRASGREALAVHRLVDAVLRSSAGRRTVSLDPA